MPIIFAAAIIASALTEPPPVQGILLLEARFTQGGMLKCLPGTGTVAIRTAQGKLTIPLAEVVSIEFALRYPRGVEAKIAGLISDLESRDFRSRDAAEKQLVEYGPLAVLLVQQALKSPSPEVVARAERIWNVWQEKLTKAELAPRKRDRIITSSMAITGDIETAVLALPARYGGTREVPVDSLLELRLQRDRVER